MLAVFKDARDPMIIETRAMGASRKTVLGSFGITEDELNDEDLDLFNRAYMRGSSLGEIEAIEALRFQMKQKGGTDACMNYLVRHAEGWPTTGEEAAGKTFKIVME